MSPRVVEEGGNIVRAVSVGGKRARKPGDVAPSFNLEIPVRELSAPEAIGAGFQAEWGSVDVGDDVLTLFSGAGFGSGWATFAFRDKTYAIGAHDLVSALLAQVAPEVLS